MADTQRARLLARISRARRAVEGVRSETCRWLKAASLSDPRRQYGTALDALSTMLGGPISDACTRLKAPSLTADAARTTTECERIERRMLAVRRLWDLFRAPFDQRAGDWKQILRAADEVAWSCHNAPFRILGIPATPPVPAVAPEVSPLALRTGAVRDRLEGKVDADFLNRVLAHMPLPIVQLPPWCLDAPWWLVFVAHEAGHHVQFDLIPGGQLETWFATALSALPPPVEGGTWSGWGREIFADMVSVVAMGPAALYAIAEIERDGFPSRWTVPRLQYPAPATRIALMVCALQHLGLRESEFEWALEGTEPAISGPETEAVVEIALGPLDGIGHSLPDLYDFDRTAFEPGGRVDEWTDHLARRTDGPVQGSLAAARLVAAAAVKAWSEILAVDEPSGLDTAWDALKTRTVETLVAVAEPGERAGTTATHTVLQIEELVAALDRGALG
jgi:hypothetical protein